MAPDSSAAPEAPVTPVEQPAPAPAPSVWTQPMPPAPPAPPAWTATAPAPIAPPAPPAGAPAEAQAGSAVAVPAEPAAAESPEALAPAALGTPPAVIASNRRPSRLVAIAAVAGVIGVVAVGAVAWLILFAGPNTSDLARDLATKMAARDATVSTLLTSPNAVSELALRMGLADLPASVSVSVSNLEAGVPTATPGTSKAQAGDQPVTATYTLTWQGSKGTPGHVDQTLTAIARKDADGKVHFVNLSVTAPIVFDLDAYFGTTGTSAADAQKVADDLKAGTKWIPGVTVDVTPSDRELTVPDVRTPVAGHLSTWSEVVSPATPGNQRTWNVAVLSGGASFSSVAAATTQTAAPVAGQVNVGALATNDAEAQAATADQAFWAAVKGGDLATANSMIAAGPMLDASGLASMKTWGDSQGVAANTAEESSGGPEDKIGTYTYVLRPDGTWGIDTGRSKLLQAVLSSTGGAYPLTGSSVEQGSGSVLCTTDITLKLKSVTFYTDGSLPEAVFSITSTNDCDVRDVIMNVTVGWSGNSAGTDLEPRVDGSDPGATVERTVELPPDLTSSMGPVWIKITKYGDPSGGVLPNTMTFTTN
jgi:hypothetical protein